MFSSVALGVVHQLCLNLGEVSVQVGGRRVRPIPDVARELFELYESSPSGLVWKHDASNGRRKAGDVAGCKVNPSSKYYLVSIRGYGQYYAHRIIYFLKSNENPGSMVVRHLKNQESGMELVLGFQDDNLRDEKGLSKKPIAGYEKPKMYEYKGSRFNLRRLCLLLGIPYGRAYHRLKKGMPAAKAFKSLGFEGVTPLYQ